MEMDSDVEMEDLPEPEEDNDNDNDNDNEDPELEEEDGRNADIDVEAVVDDDNDGDDDVDEEVDEEDEDDQEDEIQSDNDGEDAQPVAPLQLRIRLKIPAPASRSAGTETPGVESEDSMDSHPSTSTAAKPMTTRQAVLASMVGSSHVSLGGSRQSKKKVLNESELALRREETARKRKNMTEKKLEDEKLETINRLLKKQSRPRNKRGRVQKDKETMDDVVPPSPSLAGTRTNSNFNGSSKRGSRKVTNEEDADDEDAMDEYVVEGEAEQEEVREVRVPTMYRWVSTSRVPVTQNGSGNDGEASEKGKEKEKEKEMKMRIMFGVPVSVLPPSTPPSTAVEPVKPTPLARPMPCAAPGCGNPFKYRLVKDWTRGACGIACLKILESGI